MTDRISVEEYKAMLSAGAKTARRPKRPSARLPKTARDGSVVACIIRLMTPPSLGRRILLKKEETLAVAFANELRALTISGRLRCVWTHPANEIAGEQGNRAKIRYAIAKAMGLVPGTADYLFLWKDGSGALEAKHGRNGQQDNQRDFETWCGHAGVPYRLFTSVDEGLAVLTEWGVLTPATENGK